MKIKSLIVAALFAPLLAFSTTASAQPKEVEMDCVKNSSGVWVCTDPGEGG